MLRTRLTLKPGRPGTLEMLERYGSKLVCVRYRYDDELGLRYKTVELIVDEKRWTPPHTPHRLTDLVEVRLDYREASLREALKLMGAKYQSATRTWRVAYAVVAALRISSRIIPTIPGSSTDIPLSIAQDNSVSTAAAPNNPGDDDTHSI
jgi:hypothetical protein